jgi:YD repeat-containing protein
MQKNKTVAACILFALFSLLFYCSNARAASYAYDALNRLTRVFYDNGTCVMYSYDEVGNRIELGSSPFYTITSATEGYGSISPHGTYPYAAGDGQSYTFAPDMGYSLIEVQVDGMSVGAITSYTFSDISANHTITAIFAVSTFTVTPITGAHGAISPDSLQTLAYNSTASFTLTPDAGYNIAAVTGCGGMLSVSTYTTGPIMDDCTVQAIFAAHAYTAPGSSLALSLAETTYQAGGVVTPVVTNSGQQDTSVQYTFSISDSNATVIATTSGFQAIKAETSVPISLAIPAGAVDGAYIFTAEYLDAETGVTASTTFPITINGVKAMLSVRTDKQVYLPTQAVNGLSNLTNNGIALQDGILHLQIGDAQKQKTWRTQVEWQQGIRSGIDTRGLPDSIRLLSYSDSFDDCCLDSDRWNAVASAAGGALPTVDNGRLYIVMPNGGWKPSYVKTKVPIIGDFDAEVSYEVDSTNYSNGNNHPAGLSVVQDNGFNLWVDLWGSMIYGTYDYPIKYNNAGGGKYTSKFRIRRVGSSYSTYYWNGTGWKSFLNTYNRPADPAYIRLLVNGQNGNVRTHFDNFIVTKPGAPPGTDFFATSGNIRLKYDNGSVDTWDQLHFTADIPEGTSIQFRTRTAETEEGLSSAQWSSAITASGSPITSSPSRWIEVEATLATTDAITTPVLHDIAVTQGPKPKGVLWQADVPVSMATGAAIDLTHDIGIFSTVGRYSLTATLTSSTTSQTIATAEYSFSVEPPSSVTVTPSAGPGGSISPSTPQTVSYNETVLFTVTPDAGYKIASVTGCEGTLAANAFTTGPITGDCQVTATFALAQAPTTTSVSSSAPENISSFGKAVRFTATVFSADGTPEGTVQFQIDGADFASPVELLNGSATSESVSSLSVGEHVITAAYGGNVNFSPSTGSASLVIDKAAQSITFGDLAGRTYGDAPFAVSASSSSGLPVSFSASGDCAVSTDTVTINNAGSCAITASQAGDGNYYPAPSVTQAFAIAKVAQTIIWSDPADIIYGTALRETQLNAEVSVVGPAPAGALAYSPTPGTIPDLGVSTLSVSAAETENYLPATKVVSIRVKYGFNGLQHPYHPDKTYKIGRVIPLKWQYVSNTGNVLPSPTAEPTIVITRDNDDITSGDAIVLEDAGNSGYHYDRRTNTWQYNWKTRGLQAGVYSLFIKSALTGQVDGPFRIELAKKIKAHAHIRSRHQLVELPHEKIFFPSERSAAHARPEGQGKENRSESSGYIVGSGAQRER